MKRKTCLFELLIWLTGLVSLAFASPDDHHFSICPLAHMGISWCPGCGLGRSLACILQGEIMGSFRYHWFGIPALIFLSHRIYELSIKFLSFGNKPV